MPLVDDPAEAGRLGGIRAEDLPYRLRQRALQLRGGLAVGEHVVRCHAGLARVEELRGHQPGGDLPQVRVPVDERR